MTSSDRDRAEHFRALHEGEAFVIPNPWDAGTAKLLAALGFRALATTSSGAAFARGRPDGALSLDEVLDHVREIVDATALPVSADLEDARGPAPPDAATAVRRAAEAGAAGGSIEDWDAQARRILEPGAAAERISEAVEAAHSVGTGFVLTARAENLVHGIADLDDTIARLVAYERAGADVLYAPGLRSVEQIRAVCAAVGRPVNVLARPDLSLAEIAAAGARRVSVGGALTWTAVRAVLDAAEAMRDFGDFSLLKPPPPQLGAWLG